MRAVRSVLDQSVREIEAIVVMDGEDPETTRALETIRDARLRVIRSNGSGAGAARNAGAAEARAEWIAFLDDDDEWLPGKLAVQMRCALASRDGFPVIACRLIARGAHGDRIWPLRMPEPKEHFSEYLFCQRGLRGGEGLVLPSAILTKKNLLARVPFRADLPRHNDVDWLLRAARIEGMRVMFVPEAEPFVVWNMDNGRPRISNTSDWEYSLQWIRANRQLVTPRAYASFAMIWASSTAARGGHWKAFWSLPIEALRSGSPRWTDFAAHLIIWLIPERVRGAITRLRKKNGS